MVTSSGVAFFSTDDSVSETLIDCAIEGPGPFSKVTEMRLLDMTCYNRRLDCCGNLTRETTARRAPSTHKTRLPYQVKL